MPYLALREGDDLHVGIGHALEQAGDVCLVARQAIHRLRQHDPEPAACGVGDQRLDAGAQQRGAGDCMVGIFLCHLPALLLGMKTADAELVGDRGVALIVR